MPPPQKIKMYYDPRGQVVHTVNPDGTEQRVIFGVPNGAPTAQGKVNFTPTPWESYTYDANDLTSGNYAFDTPKSALVDALGRTIKTTEHRATASAEDVVMQYEYDIRGNLLKVTDALDRTAFEYTYDLKPKMGEEDSGANVLRTWHIDKGIQTTLYDASFKPIEGKDAKGSWVLNSYDNLQRPIQVWGEDRSGEGMRLAQKMVYGLHEDYNNINKIIYQYDAAGKSTTFRYDFKGNLLESSREVFKAEKILEVFDGPPTDWNITCFKADWSSMDDNVLWSEKYLSDMSYDALNRIVTLDYPLNADNTRKLLTPHYNKAGALESVEFDGTEYVNRIAYNAKGQRIMIAFGNGIMTRYAYDPQNFRLKRLKSEGYDITDLDYRYLSGTTKQDYAYFYDEVGNILNILDKTPEAGVGGSSELDRQFTYDPLYRLLSATGRENVPSESEPWQDYYRSEDRSTTSAYTRSYAYDKMGNIQELHHSGDSSFTRTYDYVSGTNKLYEFDYGSGSTYYNHDDNGNIIQETETRHFEWDYADRMRVFRNQYYDSQPTVYTQYFYDAGGNRVMKFTRKQDGPWEWTVYINGLFEWIQNSDDEKQSISHIMDDKSRIASERTGHAMGDSTPAIKYNLEDHLGSSMTLLDESGGWVSWEEYYPFGETSLGTYAKKRYRFCGKERDEESGLYYYGARYYLPWLCRFASVDPLAGKYAFYTPYQYAGNKPINFIDLDGMEEGKSSPQINTSAAFSVNLSISLGSKTKTSHFKFGFAASLMAKIKINGVASQVSFNFSGGITNGGVTMPFGQRSSFGQIKNYKGEIIISPALSFGSSKSAPTINVDYLHGNAATALKNDMKASFNYALNFHLTNDNRNQRTATYGMRIGEFSFNALEDQKFWIGADGKDRFYTGSINLNWHLNDGSTITFGSITHTGDSNNKGETFEELGDTDKGGSVKFGPNKGKRWYWAKQSGKDMQLNNAESYFQFSSGGINFRATSMGPANFAIQNMVHDLLKPNFHHFRPSTGKGSFLLSIGYSFN